jgi:superfamily II DNA or RNA helicase
MASLSELVRADKPLRTGATAIYPYHPKTERKYRFMSRFDDEVLLHKVSDCGKFIHLPRALCPSKGEVDNRCDAWLQYPKGPTPRPNQVELFEEVRSFLKKGLSGIACAYTGWGKTVLGYDAAYSTGQKTLVITTKDDIYQQWIDGACGQNGQPNFLGLSRDEVGEIRGDKMEITGKKFCVAMIHSLSKDGKYPDWIRKAFGLVIFDECHRVPAEQFQTTVDMFDARLRLGLSATPNRADGKELVVFAHIGPIRAKTEAELMVPKVLRFKSDWKCPMVFRTAKDGSRTVCKLPHEPGKTTHIEKMLAKDTFRNRLCADIIMSAYEKGRTIVVFSTLHEHLRNIHQQLDQVYGVKGRHIGYYVGASTKAEQALRETAKVKPILLTTFNMMGEGTSIDWIDTGLCAMPRSNVVQPCGRIRREYPDKKPIVWMDIVDNDSPVFQGYARKRMEWYKSIGCTIRDME